MASNICVEFMNGERVEVIESRKASSSSLSCLNSNLITRAIGDIGREIEEKKSFIHLFLQHNHHHLYPFYRTTD
ncbi:hypothetical protein DERP_010500 [Dermatophagoides pteronyssinus]|uniref:Uncharacterized protein n=1 Tax=Dermatophagoides pteronyssinus TaxID=6956 RepID=A0ABQ8JFJ6_DERPT|nr:hypothetical protein DERP_010500 [Dermatophagoides pteronyssinus]